jgi:hypothetical protein
MSAFAGPLVIAASLLALAGAQKLIDPRHTVGALRALRIPATDRIVRVGAAIELAIGAIAVATGNRVAVALVAASYLAFAGFVEVARRRGTMIGSCGCLGSRETPPSLVHVALDVALAAGVVAYGIREAGPPLDGLADAPGGGIPFLLLVAVAVGLIYAALTELPRTQAEARRPRLSG